MDITRRHVTRGAAWAIPSIAIGAAAPAVAVSGTQPIPPGLQGWTYWTRNCNPSQLVISPQDPNDGLYPNGKYGYYVYNATSTRVSSACMTFSYPSWVGDLSWKAESDNGKWSLPTSVAPSSSGMISFQTCYSGTWLDMPASGSNPAYTKATSYPHFSTSASGACRSEDLAVHIERSVIVDAKRISFTRDISIDGFQQHMRG